MSRTGGLALLTALAVVLGSCQPAAPAATSVAPSSSDGRSQVSAIPTSPASASASPAATPWSPGAASPGQSVVRDSGAGGVTVQATWLGSRDGVLAIKVALDTHSGNLMTFDAAANIVLRDSDGREVKAVAWRDESTASHHRTGVVSFPASALGPNASRAILIVRNLAGVPERALTFEFGRQEDL